MKRFLFVVILVISIIQQSFAQDISQYSREQFISGGDTLLYRMLLPEKFDPQKKYPVLFFLHGSGERGNDNEAQLFHGSKLFLQPQNRKDFPAIIIFPQCPKDDFWANLKRGDGKSSERFGFQKGGKPGKAMKLLIGLISEVRSNNTQIKNNSMLEGYRWVEWVQLNC